MDTDALQAELDALVATYAVPGAQVGLLGGEVRARARDGAVDLEAPCSAQGEGQWDHSPRSILAQTTGAPNLLPG